MDYRTALARLQASQKPAAGVPLYLRYVNRPLGRRLAALAATTRLSPNQVTGLSGLCSLLGFLALAMVAPGPVLTPLVLALLVLAFALDSADGQLARLTGRSGPAGEWLDHVVDVARIPLFHFALMVATYRFLDVNIEWMLVFLAFSVVSVVRFFALILAARLNGQEDDLTPTEGGLARSLMQLPADTGVLNLTVLLVAWPTLFLGVYCALLALNALMMGASLVRKYRALVSMNRLVGVS